jgi:hypothetical protein
MNYHVTAKFPISNDEYKQLEKSFGQLTKYASWQLIRKNAKNNHTDDFEDINQELIMSLIRAGSYYKRQIYIEKCFEIAKSHVKDLFVVKLLEGLEDLWKNRTRHGANRQKYGYWQEKLLEKIINKYVPQSERPKRDTPLEIDNKFSTYCKSIVWNTNKSIGRKITKEKVVRNGSVSLSEYEYLSGTI